MLSVAAAHDELVGRAENLRTATASLSRSWRTRSPASARSPELPRLLSCSDAGRRSLVCRMVLLGSSYMGAHGRFLRGPKGALETPRPNNENSAWVPGHPPMCTFGGMHGEGCRIALS